MKKHVVLTIGVMVIGMLSAGGAQRISAQQPQAAPPPTWSLDTKFPRGREIVPYLEGWIKNPDGSFDFVFGYYNRNTEQELIIPAGPDNLITPGDPDQGQPTYFMARRQSRIFRVRVPRDWGDKTMTWSITANGRTEKVNAKLVPSYEKDEKFIETNNNTSITLGEEDNNKPPTLKVTPVVSASVNTPVKLTALVTDDGLPKPRVIHFDDPDRPQDPAPAEPDPLARFKSQRNSSGPARLTGPRVTWQIYRGPGKVTIDQLLLPVANGQAETTAQFAAPGTYTLIASAGDGKLNVFQRITVNVK